MYGITDSMDMSLSNLREIVKDREDWCKESDTTEQLSSVQTYLQRRNKNSQKKCMKIRSTSSNIRDTQIKTILEAL